MFDSLTDKLQSAFRNITGKGKLSEDNIQDALKQIRIALLEADVNFKVVKKFVNEVKEEALGVEVTKISSSRAPQVFELFLALPIAEPVEPHVHCFGLDLFAGFVSNRHSS